MVSRLGRLAIVVVLMLSLVNCGYSIGGKLTASGNGNATAPSSESRTFCPKNTSDPVVLEWIKNGVCVAETLGDAANGTNEALIKWQRFFELIRNFFR